jgi:hypothetical protein
VSNGIVVRRENYAYFVPFVEDEHTVFLKSIITSRKPPPSVSERRFRFIR